mmetsp:Transcript_87295/g.252075  ORF Transcript_87295/g.252075 Transcript_87295/m.252075 type:complete len:315 (+) Transcript_87295:183-1127(+)
MGLLPPIGALAENVAAEKVSKHRAGGREQRPAGADPPELEVQRLRRLAADRLWPEGQLQQRAPRDLGAACGVAPALGGGVQTAPLAALAAVAAGACRHQGEREALGALAAAPVAEGDETRLGDLWRGSLRTGRDPFIEGDEQASAAPLAEVLKSRGGENLAARRELPPPGLHGPHVGEQALPRQALYRGGAGRVLGRGRGHRRGEGRGLGDRGVLGVAGQVRQSRSAVPEGTAAHGAARQRQDAPRASHGLHSGGAVHRRDRLGLQWALCGHGHDEGKGAVQRRAPELASGHFHRRARLHRSSSRSGDRRGLGN